MDRSIEDCDWPVKWAIHWPAQLLTSTWFMFIYIYISTHIGHMVAQSRPNSILVQTGTWTSSDINHHAQSSSCACKTIEIKLDIKQLAFLLVIEMPKKLKVGLP